MWTVVRNIDPTQTPPNATPKPGSLALTRHPLVDPSTGGGAMGWDKEEDAKDEALKIARAYPGNRYDVFELVLIGSAQTPIATWIDAKTTTGGATT